MTPRIGARLVTAYVEKGYKVIAAVRDISSIKSDVVDKGVIVVKLDSGTKTGAKEVCPYHCFRVTL